jgi:uncharacterized membrane protein YkvI
MKLTRILTIVFFVVLVLVTLIMSSGSGVSLAQKEVRLHGILQGLGGMIAVSAALLLLLRALDRDPWTRMTPLIVPLMAGLLLLHPHWALALTLAVAVGGAFARDLLRGGGGNTGGGGSRRFRRSPSARREPK